MRTTYSYDVAEHYLSAFINDDFSGLEPDEVALVEQFIEKEQLQGHSFDFEAGDSYFYTCEICNLKANCHKLLAWHPSLEQETYS